MRIRPFFWIFLSSVCVSLLLFAATISANKTVPMHAHIQKVSNSTVHETLVFLQLADPEGMPIDEARIVSHASMQTMYMEPQRITIKPLGQGLYLTQISFSMPGSWKIEIMATASGFDAAEQSLQLIVMK